MTLPTIKNRPALIKALALAGITEYDIAGRGANLECRVWSRRDAVMFRRKVAKWDSRGNGYNTNFRKVPGMTQTEILIMNNID